MKLRMLDRRGIKITESNRWRIKIAKLDGGLRLPNQNYLFDKELRLSI